MTNHILRSQGKPSRKASRASLAMLAGSTLALVGAVGVLFMPALEAAEVRTAECGRLLAQVERSDAIAASRDALRAEVAVASADAARVLRTIPSAPEQAHLMRMLAVGADADMGTQTIVAGDALPATPADKEQFRAVPITIEMNATFERVMQVLSRAEGDRRLVRPIRIEISRPLEGAKQRGGNTAKFDPRLVEARLELDAVFADAAEAEVENQP